MLRKGLLTFFVFLWMTFFGWAFSMTQAELEQNLALYYGNVIYVFDPQTGAIRFANERASEYYGYTPDQFIALTLNQINMLPEDDLQDRIRQALQMEQNDFVFSHRLSSGEIRTVEVHAWPVEVDGKTLLFSTVYDITEREYTKNELLKSLVKLSKAETMSNMGHYEFHLSKNEVRASEGAAKIYGLPGNTWSIPMIQERTLPEYREWVARSKEALIQEGKPYDVIFPISRATDGETRYIRSIAEYDETNNVIFGVIEDITDQRKAEEDLKNRTNFFLLILTIGVVTLLAIATLLEFSVQKRKSAEREILESKKKISAQNVELQAANEQLAATNEELNTINEALEQSFLEIESKNDSLEKSQRNFEELLQQTGAVVWQVDLRGTFTSLKNLHPEIVGYTEAEMIDKMSMYDLHPEETRESFKNFMTEVINNGKPLINYEHPVHSQNSGILWVLTSGGPVYDEQHRLAGYRGININITKRKALEEALLKSKEESEAALKAKSAFLSNMSHEIRTPMNATMGFTNLLLEKETDPEKRKMLEQIDTSNRYLLNLVNDILDLSKIEDGKLRLHEENFDLSEMLDRIVGIFSHLAKVKKLEFVVKRNSNFPVFIRGDELRLEQVLNNVLSNAVKFTEKGSVIFEISASFPETKKNQVLLQFKITDTGIGIEKRDFQRIFDKFEQAESYLTKKYGGTGLGLTITKELLERMEGSLHLESVPGKGTAVAIEIPASLTGVIQKEEKTNGLPKAYALDGVRLLVAEDNEITQSLMIKIFRRYGIEIDLVENGQKALEKLQEKSYDLLLMDIQMPLLNGIDTAKLIRQDERFDSLPIVALSAFIDQEIETAAIRSGMNGFVTKPLTPQALENLIETYILPLNRKI
ncbi:MAG: PAS domain S-box protein [Thermotogota bacterium]|nr:PAS domain S-box protein [Thermotogota bacterium]